jgi:hypothetical protein
MRVLQSMLLLGLLLGMSGLAAAQTDVAEFAVSLLSDTTPPVLEHPLAALLRWKLTVRILSSIAPDVREDTDERVHLLLVQAPIDIVARIDPDHMDRLYLVCTGQGVETGRPSAASWCRLFIQYFGDTRPTQ